jgi:hypothetical protein
MKKSSYRNSYTAKDYYKYYNLINADKLKYELYIKILHAVFTGLFDVIVKEGNVKLPANIGVLFLRRIETKPKIIEGKVRYVAPVD